MGKRNDHFIQSFMFRVFFFCSSIVKWGAVFMEEILYNPTSVRELERLHTRKETIQPSDDFLWGILILWF